MSYTVWDVETNTDVHAKRKASPFGPAHVVISAWKRKGMPRAVGTYYGRQHPPAGWFAPLLEGTKLLVGFNIKFDILHAIQDPDNYKAWMRWVAEGGQVWDCQLAEYLLHGMAQEQQMLSLDEVAPRYGGHLKNDAVKALWAAGINTTEIDRDLLMEYAIGAASGDKDQGDIGNTELVFLGQLAALRARGSVPSVLLNMGSLLCTIEMEHRGMYVDKPLGLRLAAELEVRLSNLRSELATSLPPELPFDFNWGSRHQLSALVFGGQVKYVAKEIVLDDNGAPVYYQKDVLQWNLLDGTTTDISPSDAVALGHDLFRYATFKAGKNAGEYKTKKAKAPDFERGPKMRNADFLYTFKGYTTPDPKWESSTPGVYSVAGEVIAALGNRDIPFLKSLAEMAGLVKDLGTYYITTNEEGESKGMLTLVGEDGIIHHSLNHVNTVTARFSSSNPNLQNVSGAGKSDVKSVFVSRYGTLGKIIQSDFTALEIYVQAILTKCRQLIEDLKLGLDMHCVRVAQKLGRPYEEVYKEYKDGDAGIAKLRKGAKEFSFQRAYGAGVAKIAETTGMSVEDVEALVLAEAERYPEVEPFYVALTEQIKKNRRPTSHFVPHPELPGVTCQLGRSYYYTPDHKMYSYVEHPAPAWLIRQNKGGANTSFSPTEIKNYIVQGTGGEWAKAAMWLAVRAFYEHENFGGDAVLVNQVHDALYADATQGAELRAAALLHACMDEASTLMEYQFKWMIPVPVPTETKSGSSMIEENSMPDEFKLLVKSFRTWVRDKYIAGYVPSFEKE